jgi:polar amino acid transport system permease protein
VSSVLERAEAGRRLTAETALPRRHPGRWIAMAVVLVLGAMLVHALVTNPNFQWDVVAHYFTDEMILKGLLTTLEVSVLSMTIAVVLGTVLALMRLSPNPVLSIASWLYVWFFRGTPLLVQLIFWFNFSALYQTLSLGVPFGPAFVSGNVNGLLTPFTAAVLGLSLNEAAYMCEIVRAGILSVDQGQHEAARSIGMRKGVLMRRIVLPQAMRVIIPPTGNQAIGLLKTTSLVSVISLADLLYSAEIIYATTYQTIPLLIVASLWYLVLSSILTPCQFYIERHFGKGATREMPPTPMQRVAAAVRPWLPGGHQPRRVPR